MTTLHIGITDKIATNTTPETVMVCDNDDGYQVEFTFDSEWDSLNDKTAKFKFGGTEKEVDFTGTICDVPNITNATKCEIGVYVKDKITTTYAVVFCRPSIKNKFR